MASPQESRLRTALIFSAICLVLVSLTAKALDVRLDPEDTGTGLAMIVPALGLALSSVMASGLLLAALLEHRPAFSTRRGRWLWVWTLMFTVAFTAIGSTTGGSQTIGQGVMYASSRLVAIVGVIGLVISMIPRRNRRATGR